jgi:hypothetical protein
MSALGSGYELSGALTFGGGGASALSGLSGNPTSSLAALGSDYAGAYNSALSANQTMYNNILGGYQQLMAQQVPQEQAISQGYTNLENQVLGTISGIGTSASQAIQNQYTKQQGMSQQALVNAGLGNSTVQSSVAQGNVSSEAQAQTGLANQIAGLTAGYESNLGLAGLNYRNQALQQNVGLGLQQLNFENSVMMPYPNAGMYAGLAQGYGAMQAANQARGMMPGAGGAQGLGNTGFTFPYSMFSPGANVQSGGYSGSPYSQYTPTTSPQSDMEGYGGAFGNYAELGGGFNTLEGYAYDPSAGIGTA